jgi:hypothetical protein
VERGGGNPFTPPPLQRAPEWISLCWLVERERGKGKEESCPLVESKINSKILRVSPYILEVSVAGPLNLA